MVSVTMWLSDADIQKLSPLANIASTAWGTFWGIAGAVGTTGGLAAVSAPIAAYIGGLMLIDWQWIRYINDGCGTYVNIVVPTSNVQTLTQVTLPQSKM